MTITRANPSEWGVGDLLTSAQINTIDANTAAALDRRAGKIDVLMSTVIATGAGRIISTVATGPDGDKTWFPNGGNQIVRVPTLTAGRSYTLGISGATGGDRMLFYVEGTGGSPSGYADIKNSVGTALFRLGLVDFSTSRQGVAGDSAEFVFSTPANSWQLMRGGGPGLRALEFTSSTSWVCPPGVHEVLLRGWGGGGAGGSGRSGGTPNSGSFNVVPGGGGGGGAVASVVRVATIPLSAYTITIGPGGNGVSGLPGEPGGDTKLSLDGVDLAIFKGAAGGGVGGTTGSSNTPTMMHSLSPGGAPIAGYSGLFSEPVPSSVPLWAHIRVPGQGGFGVGINVPTIIPYLLGRVGMPSAEGYSGGAFGFIGSTPSGAGVHDGAGPAFGGGGGGGGGGGPGGPGMPGGNGGFASATSNTPGTGVTPAAAAANSGAGGGGGGGGGGMQNGSLNTGRGGFGGAGGSGKLTLMIVK